MPESQGGDREVTFHYEFDPAYRIVGANGVWGGLTPRGDIRLDFFVESLTVPDSVVNLITPDGKLGPELARTPERRITRRLQVGILLSREQADDIADFLKARVAEFRRLTGEAEDAGSELQR
jgi:hypothetical protein